MYILVNGQEIEYFGYDIPIPVGEQEIHEVDFMPNENRKLCYWTGSEIVLKTDMMLLNDFKIELKEELFLIIGTNLPEINQRSLTDIQTAWQNFKTNSPSWTTESQCITAFNNAITWLGLSDDFKK